MFSNTTIVAIQCVALIAKNQKGKPITHEEISQNINISTSYLSKILTTLVKSGILLAHRGPSGGFILASPPEFITLLDIVEACEGKILGDYCTETLDIDKVCNYHKAMLDIRTSLIKKLKEWSIAKILEKPIPDKSIYDRVNCKMKCLRKSLK
ncbi:MAG: Rrf2 family transcriptional regulator [Candidatus Hydrogenedentes bacterium]|nr:Rrf2 family transcriptional regulator [Candidatus Hydrogenedentota bacterium]